jgi:hypothetical protein
MMKKLNAFFLFHVILILLLVAGCVGTVQESAVNDTNKATATPTYFSYRGLVTANSVAHDKIEITFERAPGSPGDLEYRLYINEDEKGKVINQESLSTHFRGRYYFLIENLTVNSYYDFKIRCFNKKTGAESSNENTLVQKTFNNVVANFKGVVGLSAVPGKEATAIKVQWDKVPYYILAPSSPEDPVRYEVIYSKASAEDLFNPLGQRIIMPISNITVFNHPSDVIIPGLTPSTTYYVTVRAVHRIYKTYEDAGETYIPVNRENNSKFLSFKTSEPVLWTAINDPNEFNVYNSYGEAGYTTLDTTWAQSLGSFYGYKLIYERITAAAGTLPAAWDFTEPDINTIVAGNTATQDRGIFSIVSSASDSQYKVPNLLPDAWYRLKLFVCQDMICPLTGTDSTKAIRFHTKVLRVTPLLAAFTGIQFIANPTKPTALDELELNFDPPVTNVGWADGMKFTCIDGAGHHELTTSALTAPEVLAGSVCNGLYREPIPADISSMNKLKIRGAQLDLNDPYCFAATPYTHQYSINKEIPESSRIVRCIYPEIITPNLQQYAGLETCNYIDTDKSITMDWKVPTKGIYKKYVVFWKKKSATNSFTFATAINQYVAAAAVAATRDAEGYAVDKPTCTTSDYCFDTLETVLDYKTPTDLSPGNYELGALTVVEKDSTFYWSQINTNVKRCSIPYPIATFKSWRRIFAIGPKKSKLADDDSAFTPEAIDQNGIPFEVNISTGIENSFLKPPGYFPSAGATVSLGGTFDGKQNATFPTVRLSSNSGIISLAWEDVDLDSTIYQNAFVAQQNIEITGSRSDRTFGYKVYRSDDNRVSWKELTDDSKLIQAVTDYPLPRIRPNLAASATRMAFFTDYSVAHLNLNTTNGNEQARIYWYKIVPVFEGVDLAVSNSSNSVVKVTLPPPNMALVHRWMANRAQCKELGLTPRISSNYSCRYEGLGAVPESGPFYENAPTKLDLGGDLLVDRFELGCDYSRGPKDLSEQNTLLALFDPIPTIVQPSNLTSLLSTKKGCFKVNQVASTINPLPAIISSENTPPTGSLGSKLLIGDCIGESVDSAFPRNRCSLIQATAGGVAPFGVNAPGFATDNGYSSGDCDKIYNSMRSGFLDAGDSRDPSDPGTWQSLGPLYNDRFDWSKFNLAQSHFLGVYHNSSYTNGTYPQQVVGLSGNTPVTLGWDIANTSASCSINLAAIHSTEYFPRWANLNFLDGALDSSITLDKTPAQLAANLKLYDGATFKNPGEVSSAPNLPIGRIISTNSAGAPPLTNVSKDIAAKLCNLYKVDVVVAKDALKTVISSNNSKRLLRRREFMTANMWPESYRTEEIDFLEGIKLSAGYAPTAPTPALLPQNAGTYEGACNNEINTGTGTFDRWQDIPARLPGRQPFANGSKKSNRCISRYGIQDLIGNIEEYSSEKLFCDFGPVKLFHGTVDSSKWDKSGGLDNTVKDTSSSAAWVDVARLPKSGMAAEAWNILIKGTPDNQASIFFTIKNNDPVNDKVYEFTESNLTADDAADELAQTHRPYVEAEINSGYCSIADQDEDRRFVDSDVLNSEDIYQDTFLKTLNSTLIPMAAQVVDKGSVAHTRDGNGYFLDFGDNQMVSPLLKGNQLSFPWSFNGSMGKVADMSKSGNTFVSTLLGLPLSCGGEAGDTEKCPSNGAANPFVVEAATEALLNGMTPNPLTGFQLVSPYYVGGSVVTSAGLRDAVLSKGQMRVPTSPSLIVIDSTFVTAVRLPAAPATPAFQATQKIDTDSVPSGLSAEVIKFSELEPGTDVHFWTITWDLKRFINNLDFIQGGHFNRASRQEQVNGRFSVHIGRNQNSQIGLRCGVLINEDN